MVQELTKLLGLIDHRGEELVTRFHLGAHFGRHGNGLTHLRQLFEVNRD